MAKVKMKTKKSVASKFKVSGTGKLMYRKGGKRHLLTHKSGKRKRQLRSDGIVGNAKAKMYKELIGAL